MNEIIIQPYTDQYKKEVENLILGIQQTEFGIDIGIEDQPDLQTIPGFYQVNNGNFWVARINGIVIGTISLLDIGERQAALRKMFVHKEYRGKEWGVGQKLLDTLLDWAREKNIKEIYLGTTEKFLAAQRFYEKNAFVQVDKSELPLHFPVMSVDVKFYMHSSEA